MQKLIKPRPPIVQIVASQGDPERWREASELDPELRVLPPARRLSAFVRLAVEARIQQLADQGGK
jgi:hypothetical protein